MEVIRMLVLVNLGGEDSLDEYDYKNVPDGVEVILYSYRPGSYDGSGHAFYKAKNGWGYHDLGHCSCHGPLDHMSVGNGAEYPTIDDVVSTLSDELKGQVAPLLAKLVTKLA
jgi:hypothetical protein